MTILRCWAATHRGHVREQNEDSVGLSEAFELSSAGTWQGELTAGHRAWAVVADGMGGHAAGEIASRLAVEVLAPFLNKYRSVADLPQMLASADWALREAMAQEPSLRGMGTTVCAVVVLRGVIHAFNIGDSRIYLMHAGELHRLSEDHVVHGHMLTQCLGGSSKGRELSPCIVTQTLPAYSRLLLCSDGLTAVVVDEEIRDILLNSDQPAEDLVKAALDAGGHDNVTVLVLQFEPS